MSVTAPVLGWGRYETFEYGCTLAFHDPSMNMRSYCLIAMFGMMLIPLILCIYCYCRIICYTYQCKLQLFVDHEDEDGDILNIDPMEGFGPEDQRKTDLFIKQVDPNLVEAISLMERKLTRLTLVAALGFMMAWLPFALLCLWEMATPPEEIPTSKIPFMQMGHFQKIALFHSFPSDCMPLLQDGHSLQPFYLFFHGPRIPC